MLQLILFEWERSIVKWKLLDFQKCNMRFPFPLDNYEINKKNTQICLNSLEFQNDTCCSWLIQQSGFLCLSIEKKKTKQK